MDNAAHDLVERRWRGGDGGGGGGGGRGVAGWWGWLECFLVFIYIYEIHSTLLKGEGGGEVGGWIEYLLAFRGCGWIECLLVFYI